MALPRALHSQTGELYDRNHAGRLKALLSRWSGALRLSDDAFAGHFFGRSAGDRVAQALQAAARTIVTAKTQADLRGAAEQVATAIQAVGLGNWGRFMADAQERADAPATLAAVAASQPRPAVGPDAAINKVAAPAGPQTPDVPSPDQPMPPTAAAEPEHGRIWQWLHDLGLNRTRHEQATDLRRVMGSAGGLVYWREGVPLNVDEMSDDEVLALDRETREQRHTPPLIGAAAPIMTSWGWDNSRPYREPLNQLETPGTHEMLNGRIPTREEAIRMIEDIGGYDLRAEPPHRPGRSTHNYYHVNYMINKQRATVRVQPWK